MPFIRTNPVTRREEPVHAYEIPNYHPNDTLAEIIVDAWRSERFKERLKTHTKQVFEERRLYFPRTPKVVEWDVFRNPENTYDIENPSEQIFVLPPKPETLPQEGNLLDSARAAMAYTPVGI
jgi:hypothetical protein